ncbi:MAG: aminoglycoside phosphotransferase family protein, partial [Acidobacteriota bacterium]
MRSLDPTEVSRDRSIPGLADALDARQAARWLEPHLAGIAGPGGRVRLVAARPVRHKPGRRCLIEYELDVRPAGRVSRRVVVLGKTRARGVDYRTARLVEALSAGGFPGTSEDGISVPEPLGVVPELGIWLQRKVPGVPATRLLPGPEGPALARRISAALHKLHSSGVPARRSHRMEDEMRILGLIMATAILL